MSNESRSGVRGMRPHGLARTHGVLALLLAGLLFAVPAMAVPWTAELDAPQAEKVSLAGQMTGSDSGTRPMRRGADGRWRLKLDLPAGQWFYTFVVDGKSIADPASRFSDTDGKGGRRSFVVLDDGDWKVPDDAARGEVVTVEAPSKAWGEPSRYHVYLPPGYAQGQRLPLLLLLHGRGMDADQWLAGGKIDQYMDALIAAKRIRPFIVVMPSSGTVPYTGQSEQFVMEELLPALKQTYGATLSPKDTAIAGMSMGGFGAFHLGMRPAKRFGLVVAMSAPFSRDYMATLGSPVKLPFQLLLNCGTEDAFADNNQQLAGLLKASGARFHYLQSHGGHDWNYWHGQTSRMLTQASAFFSGKTLAANGDRLRYAKPDLPKPRGVRTAVPLTAETVSGLVGRWRGSWKLSDGLISGRLEIDIQQADADKVRATLSWFVPGTSEYENIALDGAPAFRDGALDLPDTRSGANESKNPWLHIKLERSAGDSYLSFTTTDSSSGDPIANEVRK